LRAAHRACPGGGHDDPPCAEIDDGFDDVAARALIDEDDVDARQLGDRSDIEFRCRGVPTDLGAVVHDAVAVDGSERAIAAAKGVEAQRVGLGDVARGVDLIVEDDQHALAARCGFRRDAKAGQEVRGPLVAERARIAHRADDHDGFVALDGEIQEVRGFLERVGAARDDDTGEIGVLAKHQIDPLREIDPLRQRERGARDVGELFRLRPHVAIEGRDRLHQLVGRQPSAGSVRDRSAGRNQSDLRLRSGGIRRNGLRRNARLSRKCGRAARQNSRDEESSAPGGRQHAATIPWA
jgi:hypothetical protein